MPEQSTDQTHTTCTPETSRDTRQPQIDAFRTRVLDLLKQKKRTKAWLASEIGLSKQNLNYLLNHATKVKHVEKLSKTLCINPEWLMHGVGPVNLSHSTSMNYHQIPLLPWPAYSSEQFITTLHTNSLEQHPCLIVELSIPASSFAMNLHCQSMEPQFKTGSILIFDPNRTPQDKDYVLASLDNNALVFRQYLSTESQPGLYAHNHNHNHTMHCANFSVHAVLVQTRHNYGI